MAMRLFRSSNPLPSALLAWGAVVLITLLTPSAPFAQTCTGDVSLATQAEVDAFSCTSFEGNLTISGADITNLDALLGLTEIFDGTLTVADNDVLVNLDGLATLALVNNLIVRNNPMLQNVDGLAGIASVFEDVFLTDNSSLNRCCGLYRLLSEEDYAGVAIVSNNGTGCGSEQEIIDGGPCPPISLEETTWGGTKNRYH